MTRLPVLNWHLTLNGGDNSGVRFAMSPGMEPQHPEGSRHIVRSDGIKIVLVHPHLLIRAGLRCLLEARGLQVVGEAATRSEACAGIKTEQPDLVLTDADIAGERLVAALPDLLAACEHSRVLVVTATCDPRLHAEAVEAGASGIVLLDQSPDVLIKAIEKVHAGELWVDRSTTAGVLARMTRRRRDVDPETLKIQSLTRREREIVDLVGEGLKNRHIADRLFISEATVRNHLTSILDKLDLGDRFELAVYAFRHGLVTYPQPAVPADLALSGIR